MARTVFILMYVLSGIWLAFDFIFKGHYLSGGLIVLLGIIFYFVIFSGLWKKKGRKADKNVYSSDTNASWNLFISDSASDSTSSDCSGGGNGGGD